MSDVRDTSAEATERRPVERATTFQQVSADTAVVEPVHNQVAISFLTESIRPSSVEWPTDKDQPDRIGRKRLVEEVVSVRMLPEAANHLALDILVELAQIGLTRDSFDQNFAMIYALLDQRDAQDAGEKSGD